MPYFTSYDGTRLFYSVAGSGPALVCLAGGPGADVRDLGDLGGLDRHRTLVLLDARAAGRSEVPADRGSCAFTEQGRDVEELRRHLGMERVDLLAHSAGTLTAQEFAACHPERLGRLVLVTPAGLVAREVDEAEVVAIRERRAGEPGSAEALAVGALPWSYGAWSEATRRHHEAEADYPQPPSWLRETFYVSPVSAAAAAAEVARRAAVLSPVLVVAGAEDGVAGTAPARLVASCYPAARVEVLSGCGHWPWVDLPAEFCDLVAGFLGSRQDVEAGGHTAEQVVAIPDV
ncbi:proline iminopeptidase [Kitasatospora sp. MAP12-15]|uniref:alpha/beta fold hydrolase n=1 Tax=Kitasatospora sp. MAP12-15 TaxID=3035097 RepID=UPI003D2408C2